MDISSFILNTISLWKILIVLLVYYHIYIVQIHTENLDWVSMEGFYFLNKAKAI